MTDQNYQIQLHQVDEQANAVPVYPVTTGDDVIVGEIPEGILNLPGDDEDETAATALANIKKFLSNLKNVAGEVRNVVSDPEDNSAVNLATTQAVSAVKSTVDKLVTDIEEATKEIAKRAPIDHSSTDTTYGAATSTKYGHTKLSDSYASTTGTAADNGIGASQKAVADAYTALDSAKAAKSHASTDTSYGAGSSIKYGHVKLSDAYKTAATDGAADNGLAASQKALNDAYQDLSNTTTEGLAAKADTYHASAETTYGTGSSDLYGHLKVVDEYSDEDKAKLRSSVYGVSASAYALYAAYSSLLTSINSKLSKGHADETATADKFSHVKLTDTFAQSQGGAASGIAPSSKALSDAYILLSNSIDALQKSIVTLNSNLSPVSTHTEFNEDGSITVTSDTTEKVTTFNDDGSITTVLKIHDEGGLISQTITQITTFNDDGSVDANVSSVNTDQEV
jgi:hypothetical protein